MTVLVNKIESKLSRCIAYVVHSLFICKKMLYRFDFAHSGYCFPGVEGQRVLVLTVPRFCETGTVALVNLRTLEAFPMVFLSETGQDSEEIESPVAEK